MTNNYGLTPITFFLKCFKPLLNVCLTLKHWTLPFFREVALENAMNIFEINRNKLIYCTLLLLWSIDSCNEHGRTSVLISKQSFVKWYILISYRLEDFKTKTSNYTRSWIIICASAKHFNNSFNFADVLISFRNSKWNCYIYQSFHLSLAVVLQGASYFLKMQALYSIQNMRQSTAKLPRFNSR